MDITKGQEAPDQTINVINFPREILHLLLLLLLLPRATNSLAASLLTNESAGWEDWLVCQDSGLRHISIRDNIDIQTF